MRLRIYFGGASPNCGAGVRVRPYPIRRPALAHKNPTRFSRGSMSNVDMGTLSEILHITQDIQRGIVIIFVCCVLICVAAFIDMWTGIDAARTNKEKISSRSLRKTAIKITDYLRVVIFALLIDVLGLFFPWYSMPYAVLVITLGILCIEGRSVIENSRKKKSSAGEVLDIVSNIVECATKQDAEKLIRLIKEKSEKQE